MSTMCYATQQYKMADTDQVYIHVATVHVPASHQIHKGNLSRLLDLIERMEIKYGSSVFTRRSACPRETRRSRSARRQGAATPSPAQTTALGRDRPGRVPRVHRRCNAHRPRCRSLDHAAYTCGNHRSLAFRPPCLCRVLAAAHDAGIFAFACVYADLWANRSHQPQCRGGHGTAARYPAKHPILSFLPAVTLALVAAFPHSNIGLELASVILIFTSQAWNMTFSFYHSVRTQPADLQEVATITRLRPWRRFMTLELPSSVIGLLWNSMMSWAGGWFFLMASEQFTLGDRSFQLPGLGSYLQAAANAGNTG